MPLAEAFYVSGTKLYLPYACAGECTSAGFYRGIFEILLPARALSAGSFSLAPARWRFFFHRVNRALIRVYRDGADMQFVCNMPGIRGRGVCKIDGRANIMSVIV